MTTRPLDSIPLGTPDPRELRLSNVRTIHGPNIHRLAPVVTAELLLGDFEDVSLPSIAGANDRLADLVPSENEGGTPPVLCADPYHCPLQAPGGDPARGGATWAHALVHLALALQGLAGTPVSFARIIRPLTRDERWIVVVGYEEVSLGVESVTRAITLLRAVVAGTPVDIGVLETNLRLLRRISAPRPLTSAIIFEARRRGIVVRYSGEDGVVQLGLGRHLRRIDGATTDRTSALARDIATDRDRTRRLLARLGYGVPDGGVASMLQGAVDTALDVGFPVVLEPADPNHRRGESSRLDSSDDVRAEWPRATARTGAVIVERHVSGRDHQAVMINGLLVCVTERVPADATDSRGQSSVVDRTSEIHPDNVWACEVAANAAGLDIAGIDILSTDISLPFRENGAAIVGLSTGSAIRMPTGATEAEVLPSVPAAIIDMLFPPGAATSIPLITITGTNGKTTTTRLIAHLLQCTGQTVGYTTTDGVYVQGRLLVEGDMTGPFSASIILSNATVDVAVLETARGGILRAGLAFDECDVAVVLNVTSDHLGLRGIHTVEQLAAVKALLPRTVRPGGHAVLNADDPLVLAMRDLTAGDIVLFSTRTTAPHDAIDAHLAADGIAVRVERDEIVILRGPERTAIARVVDVPLTLGGAARFQLENVLAAVGAALVSGVPPDVIRRGLLSFTPSAATTPGRLNVIAVGTGRVLVDYAHNVAAVKGLLEMTVAMNAPKRVAVVSVPGDRRDDDLRAVGALCATLDYLVLKESPAYRRGRDTGDTARVIGEGAIAAGMSADRIETVLDEGDAVDRAIELMGEGGLAIVLADDHMRVVRRLQGGAANGVESP